MITLNLLQRQSTQCMTKDKRKEGFNAFLDIFVMKKISSEGWCGEHAVFSNGKVTIIINTIHLLRTSHLWKSFHIHHFISLIHQKTKWHPNNLLVMFISHLFHYASEQNIFHESCLLKRKEKWQVKHTRSTSCQFLQKDTISLSYHTKYHKLAIQSNYSFWANK